MNILLTSVILKDNFGYPSIISSLQSLWGEFDQNISLTELTSDKSEEEARLRRLYGLEHADLANLSYRKNFLKVLSLCRKYRKTGTVEDSGPLADNLRKLASYDAIVEMRGICFSDEIGGQRLYNKLFNFPLWIFGKMMGIPVVKYTTAIGPANKFSTKLSIQIYLSRFCDLALLRDDESFAICKRLNVKSQYLNVPDTAFYMPIAPCDKAEELSSAKGTRPIVGISVSHQLKGRAPGYLESMAELVNHLTQTMNAKVILIPNEYTRDLSEDDKAVARKLYEMTGQDGVEVLEVDSLTPNQIKAVVAACDTMVCARYHSVVASLSAGVPVLALSWHHKYREAMKLFGQQRHVVEKEEIGKSVVAAFHEVYDNREAIRAELKTHLPEVRALVRRGAEAFYALMGQKDRSHEGRG